MPNEDDRSVLRLLVTVPLLMDSPQQLLAKAIYSELSIGFEPF